MAWRAFTQGYQITAGNLRREKHHLIPRWPGRRAFQPACASPSPQYAFHIMRRTLPVCIPVPEQEPAVVPMLLGYPVAVTGPACYFSDATPSRAFTDVPD